jgi:hypothetical protein
VKWVVFLPMLVIGFVVYLFRGKTLGLSHQAMIWLFCLTRGRSNDFFSRIIGIFNRPYRFDRANGVLGDMSDDKLRRKVAADLRERGYHVFERRLPEDVCNRVLQYATTHACKMRPMDGMKLGKPQRTVYHREEPQAVRYDFDADDLLRNPDVQLLLSDLSFAAVAQEYLGARPVADVLGLWWHTGFSDVPDSEAAQFFHFDMDRFKWIKFFLYITDVDEQSGPHSFVAGSHRTGGISPTLLKKGYARLTDDEVKREFDERDIIEFVGPRGTIIAEDTRGLHKGKHVTRGDRLVLQLQFSNSLFGATYPKSTMGQELSENLRTTLARYPEMYAPYR